MKSPLLVFIFILFATLSFSQTIRYVKPGGSGSGMSWDSASNDIQAMINASSSGDQIWIAAGTYLPIYRADSLTTMRINDRNNAFVLADGIQLYGGFAGNETDTSQRDWITNKTILSGDFNDDDSISGSGTSLSITNNSENAYHVILISYGTSPVIIDGLNIKGGNADGTSNIVVNSYNIYTGTGGGIYNKHLLPIINNCAIAANSAAEYGGGIFNEYYYDGLVFTLQNSSVINNIGNDGGGLYLYYDPTASASINNCTISGNKCGNYGGGIRSGLTLAISNSIISDNYANSGGGIYDELSLTVINCTLSNNIVYYQGGGICTTGSISSAISNCTINNNAADEGGGVYIAWPQTVFTITNSNINGNTAQSYGGGLYNFFSSSSLIKGCHIYNNNANNGGGIANWGSPTKVINCDIHRNNSPFGGGIYSSGNSSPIITNCTITGNNTSIYQNGSTLYMNNSIVWGNDSNAKIISATLANKYSLIQGISGGNNGNLSDTLNPLFTDTAAGDFSLRSGSPLINAGSNSLYGDSFTLATDVDLAGNPRLNSDSIDIGAYEDTHIIRYVTTTGSGSGTSWSDASNDLQAMINASATGDQIWVAAGTYIPIYRADSLTTMRIGNRNNAFVLKNGVQLYGGFTGTELHFIQRNWINNKTILSGDFNQDDSIGGSGATLNISYNGENAYHVVIGSHVDSTTVLDGFTIKGGNANTSIYSIQVDANDIYMFTGGGIYNINNLGLNSPSVTILNCSLIGNSARTLGGAIYNYAASPTLINCKINKNKAANPGSSGGGLYNDAYSSSIVTNCSFTGNYAGSGGGGVCNYTGEPVFTNCIMDSNYASSGGGVCNVTSVIYNRCKIINNSSVTGGGIANGAYSSGSFTNCIISGNTATSSGGGISNYKSTVNFLNCAITKNNASNGGGVSNIDPSSPSFTNCTIADNRASAAGGGIYHNSTDTCKINNSIIWGNNSGVSIASGIVVFKYSLTQGFSDVSNGNLDGTNTANSPSFKNPSADDYSLLSCSPAVDKGSNDLYPDTALINALDLGNNPRLFASNIDMGAFENNNQPIITPNTAGVLFVQKGGSGAQNGFDWNNALPELSDALRGASKDSSVKQIWVANGIYMPQYRPENMNCGYNDSMSTFLLVKDVKLYGGFAGNEMLLSQRDSSGKSTILSGDFNQNDSISGTGNTLVIKRNGENAFHVMMSLDSIGNAELNGFTITGGNARNFVISFPRSSIYIVMNFGGGVYMNVHSSPLFNHCTLTGNAGYGGSGTYSVDHSSPTFINCNWNNNIASNGGGGHMADYYGNPSFTNCTFSGNYALTGGALYNVQYTSSTVRNCLMVKNGADMGGGIYNLGASLKIINTTITKNTSIDGGGGIYTDMDTCKVQNSIIWNNDDNVGAAPSGFIDSKYSLIQGSSDTTNGNMDGTDTTNYPLFADTTRGNFSLQFGSPVINKGNNNLYGDSLMLATSGDFVGNPRLNRKRIDLGAFENQTPGLTQSISVVPNITKTYGDTAFNPAVSTSGLPIIYTSSDPSVASAVKDTATRKWKIAIHKIGMVTMTASQPGNGFYDPANDTSFTLTINKAPLTITANSKTKVYGDTDPVFTYKINGLVNGDDSTIVFALLRRNNGENVGKYLILKDSLYASNNYTTSYINDTLTITKAVLTINGDSLSKVYGESDPPITYSMSGFVNGDDSSVVNVNLYRVPGENVGIYAILVDTIIASNYSANYNGKTLYIVQAPLTIKADQQTKVYGDSDPVFTYTASGLVFGDNLSMMSGQLYRDTGENVGVYKITIGDLLPGNNYFINFISDTLTITQAHLTIKANTKTKVYGEIDPALDYIINGLKNGDNTDIITGGLARAVGENVGIYAIEIGDFDVTSTNYTFTFTGDSLTITPALLNITAHAKTKVYGDIDPTLDYSVTGITNGDDSTVLSGNLSRNTGENAGSYTINQGSLASTDNYTINYTSDSLTITPALLNITANAKTKVYGDIDPLLDYSVSGFMNGDDSTILSGSLSRTVGENVGSYTINQGSVTATDNYSINYTGDSLTIIAASLNITAEPQTKVYGAADPSLTYTVNGLVNGDNTVIITGNLDRASGEIVGMYVINQGSISAGSNYVMTYTADSLSITPASLTITANPQTKVHGDADPIFTYTVNGFVNGDDSSIVTGTLSRNSGESVGTYAITQGNISAGTNYSIVYVGDSLTITPALGIANTTVNVNGQIQVYPNPVNAGAKLNIVSSYSLADLEGAYLQLIDLTGKIVQHTATVEPNMQISMPQTTGIYLVNLVLANGQKTCVKILVHE